MKYLCVLAALLAGICIINGEPAGVGKSFETAGNDTQHRLTGGLKLHLPQEVADNCEFVPLGDDEVPPCSCLEALTLNGHIGERNTETGAETGQGKVIDIGKIIAKPGENCADDGGDK